MAEKNGNDEKNSFPDTIFLIIKDIIFPIISTVFSVLNKGWGKIASIIKNNRIESQVPLSYTIWVAVAMIVALRIVNSGGVKSIGVILGAVIFFVITKISLLPRSILSIATVIFFWFYCGMITLFLNLVIIAILSAVLVAWLEESTKRIVVENEKSREENFINFYPWWPISTVLAFIGFHLYQSFRGSDSLAFEDAKVLVFDNGHSSGGIIGLSLALFLGGIIAVIVLSINFLFTGTGNKGVNERETENERLNRPETESERLKRLELAGHDVCFECGKVSPARCGSCGKCHHGKQKNGDWCDDCDSSFNDD